MSDETTLVLGCIGGFVLLFILVLVFVILRNRAFNYRKKNFENNTTLTVVANRNLYKVTVEANFPGDNIKFERKRIRKGQAVEFTYPLSKTPAKLIIEVDAGKPKVFEV
jgi:hypothetical protein